MIRNYLNNFGLHVSRHSIAGVSRDMKTSVEEHTHHCRGTGATGGRRVRRYKYLRVHITQDLTWSTHSGEKVKAAPSPPQAADEIQSLPEDPLAVLLWSCREPPDRTHRCQVRSG